MKWQRIFSPKEREIPMKIIPHLWFDKEAAEAVDFYTRILSDAKKNESCTIKDTPSGDAEVISFQLANLDMMAISGGPYFKLNESASLMISCKSKDDVQRLYDELSVGGAILMPLGEYFFNPYYVWLRDRFGLNWQLSWKEELEADYWIEHNFLFGGSACGRAEEALDFYATVIPNTHKGFVNRYNEGEAYDARAKINYGELVMEDRKMIFMDHGHGGDAEFTEAFSLMLICEDQDEVDFFTEKLSAVPEAQMCGWVKDQFGISWQIVPKVLRDAYQFATDRQLAEIHQAILKMKKLDVAIIEGILKK